MNQPFGGLLGDTCETRLLQFLLPMYGIEFNMADLVEEIGLTRQSIAKAMNKFAERGMVKIRKEGRTPLYSINEDSQLVKRLEDFDNSLVESIVGEEKFREFEETYEKSIRSSVSRAPEQARKKIVFSHNPSNEMASSVASREAAYSAVRKPSRKKITAR